jgi:hypothetical protein
MRISIHVSGICVIVAAVIQLSGCTEKTPSRDHIPLLKERIYSLQEAVKDRNRPAMDSLLSPEILSIDQSSDSLLRFVYGADGQFPFERFGDCEIIYTNNIAHIDCFVMDSTNRTDRPIAFTFTYKHDLWLLKRFEAGRPDDDSL